MSNINNKLFKKSELINKKMNISIVRLNRIIRDNKNKLKFYEKVTDINELRNGYDIRFINLYDEVESVIRRGGSIYKIFKKKNGDYRIAFEDSFGNIWNILYSKSVIFYKTKPVSKIRQELNKKWKSDTKRTDPQKYKEWLKSKKIKIEILKSDPELYKLLYQHYKKSKKSSKR